MMLIRRAIALGAILCFSVGFASGQPPRPQQQQQQPQPIPRRQPPSISGRVLFERDLKEAPSVLVKLLATTGIPIQQTFTRSRGEFEFRNLREGLYIVEVVMEGYEVARQSVDISFGSRPGVMLLLKSTDRLVAKKPKRDPTVSVRELGAPRKAQKAFRKGLRELNEKNRPERSINHFQKAIELYPEFDEAYVQLSIAQFSQGEIPAAQETLERALAVNRENARAHALLGVVFRQQEQIDRSEEALQEAVKLEAGNWLAHLELAKTLLRSERLEDALGHARQAHELNGQSTAAHLLLYHLLIRQRNYEIALEVLEKFLALHPDYPSIARLHQVRDKLRAAVGGEPQ